PSDEWPASAGHGDYGSCADCTTQSSRSPRLSPPFVYSRWRLPALIETAWCVCRARNAPKHAAEDEVVDRTEQVPVSEADISGWIEDGGLAGLGSSRAVGADLELQPEPSGDLHLRSEAQDAISLQTFHAPEVDRVA